MESQTWIGVSLLSQPGVTKLEVAHVLHCTTVVFE